MCVGEKLKSQAFSMRLDKHDFVKGRTIITLNKKTLFTLQRLKYML